MNRKAEPVPSIQNALENLSYGDMKDNTGNAGVNVDI